MIDVYYPYYHNESKWEELRYSLRSIDKHLKEDYQVYIIGDKPEWIQNVVFISHKRNNEIAETCTYDAISKLQLFLEQPGTSQAFIRMYDDICLLQDMTRSPIAVFRAMYDLNSFKCSGVSFWFEQLERTLNALKSNGLTTWNTETHLPELFYKEGMKEVFKKFNPLQNRFLTSSLYFNYWYTEQQPVIEKRTHGAKFYGDYKEYNYPPEVDPAECCSGKLFLNYNNAGLTDKLKTFIEKRFPEKSKFEI